MGIVVSLVYANTRSMTTKPYRGFVWLAQNGSQLLAFHISWAMFPRELKPF